MSENIPEDAGVEGIEDDDDILTRGDLAFIRLLAETSLVGRDRYPEHERATGQLWALAEIAHRGRHLADIETLVRKAFAENVNPEYVYAVMLVTEHHPEPRLSELQRLLTAHRVPAA